MAKEKKILDGKEGEVLQALLERSAAAILIVDNNRRYVEASQAALDLIGYTKEELLQMTIGDISPEEMKDKIPEMFEAFLKEGNVSGPYVLHNSKGEEISVHYSGTANIVPGYHIAIFTRDDQVDLELDLVEEEQKLNEREREILAHLALGETNQTIAKKMFLSPETVRNYTRSAREKLGARSRSQAIAIAISRNELDLDSFES